MPTSAPRSPLLLALLLAAPACGDDDGTASATGSTSTATDTTGEDTGAPATASTTGDSHATTAPTSGSATSSPTASTTDASTTDTGTTASTTGADEALPPTDSAERLEQWLAGGAYKTWSAESQVHPSDGPHGGNVRTYVNTALAQSLAGAAAMHPQGAATVKELYGGGTMSPRAHIASRGDRCYSEAASGLLRMKPKVLPTPFSQGSVSDRRCAGSSDEKPEAVNAVPTYLM